MTWIEYSGRVDCLAADQGRGSTAGRPAARFAGLVTGRRAPDRRYAAVRAVAYRRTQLCLAAWMGRTNWRRISSKLDAWAPFLMLVLIGLLLGPAVVSNAFTAPSGWNWFMFGLWVFVVVGQIWQCVKGLRRRGERGGERERPLIPADVPVADVEAAIASTTDRISAIKALREQHRGLGLKAAADLVDGLGPRDT